jgi:hypothetical protein
MVINLSVDDMDAFDVIRLMQRASGEVKAAWKQRLTTLRDFEDRPSGVPQFHKLDSIAICSVEPSE